MICSDEIRKPVTNQVTTPPNSGRRSRTQPDKTLVPGERSSVMFRRLPACPAMEVTASSMPRQAGVQLHRPHRLDETQLDAYPSEQLHRLRHRLGGMRSGTSEGLVYHLLGRRSRLQNAHRRDQGRQVSRGQQCRLVPGRASGVREGHHREKVADLRISAEENAHACLLF
jgi:hypothetical protein